MKRAALVAATVKVRLACETATLWFYRYNTLMLHLLPVGTTFKYGGLPQTPDF